MAVNDVALEGEKAASRNHCTLEQTVEGWKLVDQMSANGTAVNGAKVNFAFLKPGDVITIGATRIEVLAPAPAAAASAPVVKAPPRTASSPGVAPVHAPPVKGPAPVSVAPAPVSVLPTSVAPAGRPHSGAPRRPAPVGGIIALVLVFAGVIAGGYFLFSQLSDGGSNIPEHIARENLQPAASESSQREQAALGLLRELQRSTAPVLERIQRLDRLDADVRSFAGGDLRRELDQAKRRLVGELEETLAARVQAELDAIDDLLMEGLYAEALAKYPGLYSWLDSSPYLESLGRTLKARSDRHRARSESENDAFVRASQKFAWDLMDDQRFEDSLGILDDVMARAYLDAEELRMVQDERRRILEAIEERDQVRARPDSPEGPATPSLHDLVERDETGQLSGDNPLLPKGQASEREALASLHARLVQAIQKGELTGRSIAWRGDTARITGASEDRITLEVAARDPETGEDLLFRTAAPWERILPRDMLALYESLSGLEDSQRLAIIIFAFNHGEINEAARRAALLLRARPEWAQGIFALVAEKRRIPLPEGGFVEYDGALVTREEAESAQFLSELRGLLQTFESGIFHRDRRRRAEAEAAFQEVSNRGERAIEPAVQLLQEMLQGEMRRAEEAAGVRAADTGRLNDLVAELDRRREHALELIMDEVKYPYPYGPDRAVVQAEVNARVAAVREIWNDPLSFAGRSMPDVEQIFERVRDIAGRMGALDPARNYHESTPEEMIDFLRGQVNARLTVKTWPGRGNKHLQLINHNREVMEYNEKFPAGQGHTDADGRMQVKVTNEYRMMMGRVALKLNDKLFWAAWHHSKYCVEVLGTISHDTPGAPRGTTPFDRMAYEGYNGPGGENIHMNSGGPTAQSAHDAWLQSSGHHRNILRDQWRVLGSAKFRTIWTQNFGGLDEGEGNAQSRGGA
jgi:uncharacterized protein YkwD